MPIKPDVRLMVRTAFGDEVERRAISGIDQGDRFPVVWVATEEEWTLARSERRQARGEPWPADAVRVIEETRV
jgi:hypothetical protein